MSKQADLKRVYNAGIVAVVRADSGELLADVSEALLAGGIDVIEITFTVPGAVRVLEQTADRIGDRILLGAGTILDSETARIAMLAGAEFIVSPSTNLGVIEICNRYDKAIMAGAFTPTEVITAWQAGADVIKVFPCDTVGPGYLKSLKGPFPQVEMMPTGGVTLETTADFLRNGAFAVGAGSALVEKDAVARGDLGRIESLARQYVSIVREFRPGT